MGISIKRGKDFKLVDPGMYEVVLEDVEKKAGKDGLPPWLSWKFKICGGEDDEFVGQTLYCASGLEANAKNRLGQLCNALGNIDIKPTDDEDSQYDEGEDIADVDEFIGRKCRLFVEHQTKGDKTVASVKSILPLTKKKKKVEDAPKDKPAKPTKPAPAESEDDDAPPAGKKPKRDLAYDDLVDDEDESSEDDD